MPADVSSQKEQLCSLAGPLDSAARAQSGNSSWHDPVKDCSEASAKLDIDACDSALLASVSTNVEQPLRASASKQSCSKCQLYQDTLLRIQDDYNHNLKVIGARDQEISTWEERDIVWKRRLRECTLENDTLTKTIKLVKDQLAQAQGAADSERELLEAKAEASLHSRETNWKNSYKELQVQYQATLARLQDSQKRLELLEYTNRQLESKAKHLDDASVEAKESQAVLEENALRTREKCALLAQERDLAILERDRARGDAEKLRHEKSRLGDELKHLTRQISQLRSELEQLDRTQIDRDAALETAQKENSRINAQLKQVKENASSDEEHARKLLFEARRDLEDLRNANANETSRLKEQLVLAQEKISHQAHSISLLSEQAHQRQSELGILPIKAQWDQERHELVSENEQLASVIKEMRAHMELINQDQAKGEAEATARQQELQNAVKQAESSINEKSREIESLEKKVDELQEKVKFMSFGRPLDSFAAPYMFQHGVPMMPVGAPTMQHPFAYPQQFPENSLQIQLHQTIRQMQEQISQLHQQLAEASTRYLNLMDEREHLIEKSNELRAEMRQLEQVHNQWVPPPLTTTNEMAVQTIPVLVSLPDTAPRKVSRGAKQVAGRANESLGPSQASGGLLAVGAKQKSKPNQKVTAEPHKSAQQERAEALIRLRKRGLRNWNEIEDREE